MSRNKVRLLCLICLMSTRVLAQGITSDGMRDYGHFTKWSKIEISFTGPASQGRGQPNPFSVVLDVVFTSPSGEQYDVPGFYDGNGRGSLDGDRWEVRFSADELGRWTFRTRSNEAMLDGKSGYLTVI